MHEAAVDYEQRQLAYEQTLEETIHARERRQQEERLAALRAARALREEQDAAYNAVRVRAQWMRWRFHRVLGGWLSLVGWFMCLA